MQVLFALRSLLSGHRDVFISRGIVRRQLAKSVISSSNEKFRQIQPDGKVLEHLDKLGIGFMPKRLVKKAATSKERRSSQPVPIQEGDSKTKKNNNLSDMKPFPFDRGPRNVKNIDVASVYEEVKDYSDAPEIAIVGRSNVGKSTLINALLGFQSHIQEAKVSVKPGETQVLQFFCMGTPRYRGPPALVVVDMPGYGFAYLSDESENRIKKLVSL